ncbi:MAG TPA: hypothetical protein VEX68_04905 [Bryobacteraceae bacterium]|nr:hypothetical protein [Bryobacteraceae bacterium]
MPAGSGIYAHSAPHYVALPDEAMYFLEGIGGWTSQKILWEFIGRHGLKLHTPKANEADRMRALMEKYSDTPMDLADASLVATAEARQLRRVFTLDVTFGYTVRAIESHSKSSLKVRDPLYL